MTPRALLLILTATLTLGLTAPAHAVECVAAPLPTTPLPPAYGMDVQWFSDKLHVDIWRQPCTGGGEGLLVRLAPITSAPFACSSVFHLLEAGLQYAVSLRASFNPSSATFCDNLFVPTTLAVFPAAGTPAFTVAPAFELLFSGYDSSARPLVFSLSVPPESAPPPPAPPSILVVDTGCTVCHAGNLLAFEAHVTNPGAPLLVELKAGVRLPDGTPISVLAPCLEQTFPTGTTVVHLLSGTMPSGVAPGTYIVEAAILEPELGATFARASLSFVVQ